jgi:sigma-54 dependent transcriptional regulator, acetoin dehydrogenase operon transcriptional activator AcoR
MSVEEVSATTMPEMRARGAEPTEPVFLWAPDGQLPGRVLRTRDGIAVGRLHAAGAGEQPAGEFGVVDALLSRRHFRIFRRSGGYDIEDVGSLNGTFVDGRRIEGAGRIADGAIVLFGRQAGVWRRVSAPALAAIEEQSLRPFGPTPTLSPGLALSAARLAQVAVGSAPILLVGETGVGRQSYARAIHAASRRPGSFVTVDCGSAPIDALETSLFGAGPGMRHLRRAPIAALEMADRGTIFLRDADRLPVQLRVRLCAVLRGGSVTGIVHSDGGDRTLDVRLVASTTHVALDHGDDAASGELAASLDAEVVRVPPLRERPEDIPGLIAQLTGGTVREVEPAALRAICLHTWPFNVRELKQTVERAATLAAEDGVIRLEHLPAAVRCALDRGAPIEYRRRPPRPAPTRGELERLLRQHRGNVSGVARSLDRKWAVVWRWIARYELPVERYRQ